MKKALVIVFIVVMLVLVGCSCGKKVQTEDDIKNTTNSTSVSTQNTTTSNRSEDVGPYNYRLERLHFVENGRYENDSRRTDL